MTAKKCILKSDDVEIEECEGKIGAGAGSSRSFNRGRGMQHGDKARAATKKPCQHQTSRGQ